MPCPRVRYSSLSQDITGANNKTDGANCLAARCNPVSRMIGVYWCSHWQGRGCRPPCIRGQTIRGTYLSLYDLQVSRHVEHRPGSRLTNCCWLPISREPLHLVHFTDPAHYLRAYIYERVQYIRSAVVRPSATMICATREPRDMVAPRGLFKSEYAK